MDPGELTAIITLLANGIAEGKSEKDINLIASALIQLGYTLETIAATRK